MERLAADRGRAGQEFIQDHAQGVDVGPHVDVERVERRLLGGHVERGSGDRAERREQALLAQLHPAGGLGQAEVDHRGDRDAVVVLDQDVCRLQVAVDDPLLVRVLHGRANLPEERQAFGQAEAVLVAIVGQGDALDQFHDEERVPTLGRPGVEHMGDMRVIHDRQGLPLGVEPGQDRPGVHPRLDQLQRHHPLDRLELLGQIHQTHAAFADLLADLVAARDGGPDRRGLVDRTRSPFRFDPWFVLDSGRPRGHGDRLAQGEVGQEGSGQGGTGLVKHEQELVDSGAQLAVVAAFLAEENGPIGGAFEVEGGPEKGFEASRIKRNARSPPGGKSTNPARLAKTTAETAQRPSKKVDGLTGDLPLTGAWGVTPRGRPAWIVLKARASVIGVSSKGHHRRSLQVRAAADCQGVGGFLHHDDRFKVSLSILEISR